MVKIRLKRMGRKKRPFYRIVAADSRSPRDGRVIEELGYYDPLTQPKTIKVNLDSVEKWVGNGAQFTPRAQKLVNIYREREEAAQTNLEDHVAEEMVNEDIGAGADSAEGLAADMVEEADELENQGE